MYVRGYLQGSENGRVVTIAAGWFSRPIKCQILARMRISELIKTLIEI
jgi:predicted mannosyl-3-phosphoglycerate phosphatase (HAD superfamily)